jgi:hypothetical protein
MANRDVPHAASSLPRFLIADSARGPQALRHSSYLHSKHGVALMSLLSRHNTLALSLVLAISTLTACGGGGGSNVRPTPATPAPPAPPPASPPAPPPAPPAPPPSPPAPSGYNPSQLDPENVQQAWAVGGTPSSNQGQGVAVGILDTGVQADNPALVNRVTWFKDYVDPTNTTPQDD